MHRLLFSTRLFALFTLTSLLATSCAEEEPTFQSETTTPQLEEASPDLFQMAMMSPLIRPRQWRSPSVWESVLNGLATLPTQDPHRLLFGSWQIYSTKG